MDDDAGTQPGLVVIGVGSVLYTDEGVGVYLLRLLSECQWPDEVEFIELGVGGLRLLHLITGRSKVILLDCAFMGETPGTIRRFTPVEVTSRKVLSGFSLHEGDLLSTLNIANTLGEAPDEVVIFGIEPSATTPGMELSPVLTAHMDEYQMAVTAEIQKSFKL
ncbi:MAG: hydrogenase maturation protease [Armatimonadota bacterium]